MIEFMKKRLEIMTEELTLFEDLYQRMLEDKEPLALARVAGIIDGIKETIAEYKLEIANEC